MIVILAKKEHKYFITIHPVYIKKGPCEVNHELLRRILHKGASFNDLTQEDINLIMSHINSYKRKKLNNKSSNFVFSSIYVKDTLDKLGIIEIDPNKINLTNSLIKNKTKYKH